MDIDNRQKALMAKFAVDPVFFVQEIFKPDEIYEWQKKALRLYAKPECRLAIRSGHGIGKTAFLSWVALHFLLTHFPAKVPCTAPTSHQLFDLLWAEISKWARRMPSGFRDVLEIKSDRVVLKGFEKESFIVARTARKETPEAFQGFHGDNLLFIVDESAGVDDIIFEVGEGAMSSAGAKAIETGNPTRLKGHFADVFKGNWGYELMTVSSYDSPAVSRRWLAFMVNKYGEDSNIFRYRVLGQPPLSDDDSFLPYAVVHSAVGREVETQPVFPVWGLDVARGGKCKSALCKRHGNVVPEPIKFWSNKDSIQLTSLVIEEYEKTRDASPELLPVEIYVDIVGMGTGVYDRLCELGLPAIAINVGEGSSFKDLHLNLKMDLWDKALDWFITRNCAIPDQPDFEDQLTSVGAKFTIHGKKRMQTKEELMANKVDSPDLADSFILTFAGTDMPSEQLYYDREQREYKAVPLKRARWSGKKKKRNTSWLSF